MKTKGFLTLLVLCLTAQGLFAQETVHILSKGETLYSIARTYGVHYEDIIKENGINDPRRLQVGQRIVIPLTESGRTEAAVEYIQHTVLRGETLYGIARHYAISIAQLRSANGLSENYVLREGVTLKIPRPAASVSGTASSVQQTAPQTTQQPVQQPPPVVTTPPAAITEVRPTITKELDTSIRWPIQAKDIAYMTGKLSGVVLGGERSEPVYSLSSGTVVSSGPYRGFGRVVIVQAPEAYLYVYGGCETLHVKEGDKIVSGSILGQLGVDALSEKPQLFLMVYKNNEAMDPAKAPR